MVYIINDSVEKSLEKVNKCCRTDGYIICEACDVNWGKIKITNSLVLLNLPNIKKDTESSLKVMHFIKRYECSDYKLFLINIPPVTLNNYYRDAYYNFQRYIELTDCYVGLFFYIKDRFYLSRTSLAKADTYGKYLIHNRSHYDVWEKQLRKKFNVDFDYFPRGRYVFDTECMRLIVYTDECIIDKVKKQFPQKCDIKLDEHYKCHRCNDQYNN